MLEAHVQFELGRLTGEALAESLRAEVAASFTWLNSVRLADVAPAQSMADATERLVVDLPPTPELVALIAEVVAAGHGVLLEEDRPISQVLRRDDFDAVFSTSAGMDDLWGELIDVITASQAYARLVSHVLYHGLKAYVLTENLFARKIPGASSLVRLGQRGLTSAAPGFEAGIDRHLMAFVAANIADTLRESQRYLRTMLDQEMLSAVATEAWQANADRTVASGAALVHLDAAVELTGLAGEVWEGLQRSGLLGDMVRVVVDTLLEAHGDRVVGEILAELGLTPDVVADTIISAVTPAVEHARETGLLEERIRLRLQPFYASYTPPVAVKKAAVKQAASSTTKKTTAGESTKKAAAKNTGDAATKKTATKKAASPRKKTPQ